MECDELTNPLSCLLCSYQLSPVLILSTCTLQSMQYIKMCDYRNDKNDRGGGLCCTIRVTTFLVEAIDFDLDYSK